MPTTCKQTRTDITATDSDYFYYRGGQLVNIIGGQGQSQHGQRFFQTATGLAAQINMGGNAGAWLIGTDVLGSVLGGSDGENAEEHRYAPYGGEKHQGSMEDVIKLGYTGAYRDPLTGLYPLGNGARCYLPELMCFNKADDLSPFGAGGINTRSYCEGDPINYSDPSGHAKEGWGFMFFMTLFGMLGGPEAEADSIAALAVKMTQKILSEATEEASGFIAGEEVATGLTADVASMGEEDVLEKGTMSSSYIKEKGKKLSDDGNNGDPYLLGDYVYKLPKDGESWAEPDLDDPDRVARIWNEAARKYENGLFSKYATAKKYITSDGVLTLKTPLIEKEPGSVEIDIIKGVLESLKNNLNRDLPDWGVPGNIVRIKGTKKGFLVDPACAFSRSGPPSPGTQRVLKRWGDNLQYALFNPELHYDPVADHSPFKIHYPT